MRSKLTVTLVCRPAAGPADTPVWLPSNEKPCCRLAAAWAANSASTSPVPCGKQAAPERVMACNAHQLAAGVLQVQFTACM